MMKWNFNCLRLLHIIKRSDQIKEDILEKKIALDMILPKKKKKPILVGMNTLSLASIWIR